MALTKNLPPSRVAWWEMELCDGGDTAQQALIDTQESAGRGAVRLSVGETRR